MERFSDHFSFGPSMIPNPKVMGGAAWGAFTGSAAYHTSSDASLFSTSLPVLPHDKLATSVKENRFESIDDASSRFNRVHQHAEDNHSHEAVGAHEVGNVLPDDEEDLIAGIMDELDLLGLPSRLDDSEEYDFFGSGGMELDSNAKDNLSGLSKLGLSDGGSMNGMTQLSTNGVATVAGEHPFGEHPSRTLFVRNINSNVEDSELKSLFEQHGDIRTLYTACKHRGFVMISYYDIRAARTAMRVLQNKPLRRRKLDIHFSIPKDNPSDKDINQGTLVVFNLDPSVSNDDLMQIFGDYGEVKEIRETPHKRHHKFIEYYDIRAAEAALRSLNRSDIAGKRIKLEPSRPGGARRNLILQLNQDIDHDETQTFRIQAASPLANSPPGNWGQFNSPIEHSSFHTHSLSPGLGTASPSTSNHSQGLASILHPRISNSVKIAPIGKVQGRSSTSVNPSDFSQSHSLPDSTLSQYPETISSSFGASTSNGSAIETLSGPQFLWGSPKPQSEQTKISAWPRPSMGHPLNSNGQSNNIPQSSHHGSFLNSSLNHQNHHFPHNHHIGSAPSGHPLERHYGFIQESPETSYMNSGFRSMGLGHNDRSFMMNMGNHTTINAGFNISGNMPENGSPNFRMMSSPRLNPMFLGPGPSPYPGRVPTNMDSFADRGRIRRGESNVNQMDTKRLFQLDLEKIISGEDTRTTLMIKNIPNKYTSKMLLAAIDEYNRGTYDFIYLPIDFKNKCNVGYAFINMLSPQHIIQFYKVFNGKRWEKFNSEKVASLAYARIQGKSALVTHFQNSSLMNEDKRCRPILFHSDGPEAGTQIIQEHLPSNSLNIPVRQPNGFQSVEDFLGRQSEAGSVE